MDGKFWQEETKDLIVKAGDDAINLPWYLEPADGPAIRWIVNWTDKKADQYVPDEIDPLVNEGIKAGFNGDWDTASEKIGTAWNKLVDIPGMSENSEQSLFVNSTRVIVDLMRNWITQRRAAA